MISFQSIILNKMDLFNVQLQKQLLDKNPEKQRLALREVEQMILGYLRDKPDNVRRVILYFQQLVAQSPILGKRQALFSLNMVANILIREHHFGLVDSLVGDLIPPVLGHMENSDPRVRMAVLEYLFYMSKALQSRILLCLTEIFDSLLFRADEENETLLKAVFLLDSALKQIVITAARDRKYLQIQNLIPSLQFKMKIKSVHHRTMLLTWIKCFNQIPNSELFNYLPQLLDGLFQMLEDQSKEVRQQTDQMINEFFQEIEEYAIRKSEQSLQVMDYIMSILIGVCGQGTNLAKLSAVLWIFEFLRIYSQHFDDMEESQNEHPLRRIIIPKAHLILKPILELLCHEDEEHRKAATKANQVLFKIFEREVRRDSFEYLEAFTTVQQLINRPKQTAEQALIWMNQLLKRYSSKILPDRPSILDELNARLNRDEEAMEMVIEVISTISLQEQYFELVIDNVAHFFFQNRAILDKKGDFIITKLCGEGSAAMKVFKYICTKLTKRNYAWDFTYKMIQTLEQVLVTEKDLHDLRCALKNKEDLETFKVFFKAFSYSPVSVITLCFLAEKYELAYSIMISFSEIEINLQILIALGRLVNMLESGTFVYLRLQLLEYQKYPYLLKSLQGLMMLLPQGEMFQKLKTRLKYLDESEVEPSHQEFDNDLSHDEMDELINHFRGIRDRLNEG